LNSSASRPSSRTKQIADMDSKLKVHAAVARWAGEKFVVWKKGRIDKVYEDIATKEVELDKARTDKLYKEILAKEAELSDLRTEVEGFITFDPYDARYLEKP
jgi:hypothetical protein